MLVSFSCRIVNIDLKQRYQYYINIAILLMQKKMVAHNFTVTGLTDGGRKGGAFAPI